MRKCTKLWLDDVRTPPDSSYGWFTEGSNLLLYIIDRWYDGVAIEEISFDHDLGEGVADGYDIAKALVAMDVIFDFLHQDFKYQVHSANPCGKANISGILDSYLAHKRGKSVSAIV